MKFKMKYRIDVVISLCFFLSALLFGACGQDITPVLNQVQSSDPSANSNSGATTDDVFYSNSFVQNVATAFTANGATVSTISDEGDSAVRLFAPIQTNAPGAFNGGGTGNKALIGLSGFHSLKLSEFISILFAYKQVQPTALLYVNLQIDFNCNGNFDVGTDKIWAPSAAINTTPATWLVFYTDRNTAGALYPGASASTLNQVLTSHPLACLFDGNTSDGGMPKLAETKAISLVVSDSSNQSHIKEVLIDNVQIMTGSRKVRSTHFGF